MPLQLTPRRTAKPPRYPNRIREYRIRSGMTQRALAAALGFGRRTITSWECGRALPMLPNLFRLARGLDTLAESLYQDFYRRQPGTRDVKTPKP